MIPVEPIWTALGDLHKRVASLEESQKTVASSLKGLLELCMSQKQAHDELLDVLGTCNKVDSNMLDQLEMLANRVEENENAANIGQSPSKFREQQKTIDREYENRKNDQV
jgi:hypothetical protein